MLIKQPWDVDENELYLLGISQLIPDFPPVAYVNIFNGSKIKEMLLQQKER